LPKRRTTINLDFRLNKEQSARVRQGFIPAVMEEKWFAYFENNTLYLHRSWTGYCIDQIHFVEEDDGLRATHAEVNRYSRQYENKDDTEDRERIITLVMHLAELHWRAQSKTVDSMAAALAQAMQPLYLGSPSVMNEVVSPYFAACVGVWRSYFDKSPPIVTHKDKDKEFSRVCDILCGDNPEYTLIPDWHTAPALGQAAILYFCLDPEYCTGESLQLILVEGMSAIGLKIMEILRAFQKSDKPDWNRDALPRLNELQRFVVAVLMGTNTVFMPGKTLENLGWSS
ncbi:MAG: hypothetical protein ACXW0L_06090, partial [Methylosarcina sp.]